MLGVQWLVKFLHKVFTQTVCFTHSELFAIHHVLTSNSLKSSDIVVRFSFS